MLAFNNPDLGNMPPVEISKHLRQQHYRGLKILLKSLFAEAQKLVADERTSALEEMVYQFSKEITAALVTLIEMDEEVLLNLADAGQKLSVAEAEPLKAVTDSILSLLPIGRNLLNNYVADPEWRPCLLDTCNELFKLEQLAQQAIYIREYFLLKKMIQ